MIYPIPQHSTWDIIDSTKLQTYMDCPRRYFYEYILGWQGEAENVHLIFGSAWHLAMEHLILHGYSKESVAEAWHLLNTYYRKHFSPEDDELRVPKTPGVALNALVGYVNEYRNDEFEVLYTEIAGTVPITNSRVMHFRMDSILRYRDGIGSLEHKTGSTLTRQWQDQWLLNIQTGTYNHVLYCLFPEDQVKDVGVVINGAIFNKTKTQYKRVPARRTKKMMNVWYWNVRQWVSQLDEDMASLALCKDSDPTLYCFKQNTQSCTKYFGCPWTAYCISWANPLQYVDEPPYGCVQRWWDPSNIEDQPAKVVFDLENYK